MKGFRLGTSRCLNGESKLRTEDLRLSIADRGFEKSQFQIADSSVSSNIDSRVVAVSEGTHSVASGSFCQVHRPVRHLH